MLRWLGNIISFVEAGSSVRCGILRGITMLKIVIQRVDIDTAYRRHPSSGAGMSEEARRPRHGCETQSHIQGSELAPQRGASLARMQ